MFSKTYVSTMRKLVAGVCLFMFHFENQAGPTFSSARKFSSDYDASSHGMEMFFHQYKGQLRELGSEIENLDDTIPRKRALTAWWDAWLDCNHGPQDNQEYASEAVAAHNQFRQEVGIPDIQWSSVVAARAQEWADYLSKNQLFEHSPGFRVGENIAMGSPRMSVTQATNLWGEEKKDFVYGTFPDVSSTGNWADVGHYTQIVWRNTNFVGCGSATGADGYVRVVCQYTPNGNFRGERPY